MADCAASLASPEDAPIAGNRLRVLLPLPLPGALDYRAVAGEAALEPGRFVRVNLGPRKLIVVVWEGEGDDGYVEDRGEYVACTWITEPLIAVPEVDVAGFGGVGF